MPSSKKKRGGKGKGSAERQRALAIRAERKLPIEALPPFPGPETPEQETERILGYKHLCASTTHKPVSVTRKGEGTFLVQEFTNDMEPSGRKFFLKDGSLGAFFQPDYDRNAAAYPVAEEFLSNRRGIDMSRRLKKRIKDVPSEKLAVFQQFIEGGDGIEVVCGSASGIPTMEYSFVVKLAGEKYSDGNVQAFTYFGLAFFNFVAWYSNSTGESFVTFVGALNDSKCLEKYQKDLVAYLMHECMVRVAAGTAKIEDDVSPNELEGVCAQALCVMHTERKNWKEMIGVTSFVLSRAIENKRSLNETSRFACELGEALEACAFYSQAALLYAEAGKHFHQAEDPKAARVFHYTGLAWKRHGDYAQAESFYALSLQSMHFQHDHKLYHHEVFNTLKSLFLIYYDPVKNIAPLRLVAVLRALILAAGEEPPINVGFADDGTPALRAAYHNAPKEQICRVIQSVVNKSTSVKELRAAILGCGNPGSRYYEPTKFDPEKHTYPDQARGFLEESRGYLQGCFKSTGFIGECSACGELKDEKKLSVCSACKSEYYCDAWLEAFNTKKT